MPVNVKVIHTKDFIRTTATGALDSQASKQALLDIASRITQPGEYEVLIDARRAEPVLSTTERYELGVALAAHPALRQSKIALLVPMSDADNARFLETVAQNRGAHIKAFTDFELAIGWLVMEELPS